MTRISPYAGTPGRGPAGKTCRQCHFLVVETIGRWEKKHPFCRVLADLTGPMANSSRPKVWTGTKACEHYEKIPGMR